MVAITSFTSWRPALTAALAAAATLSVHAAAAQSMGYMRMPSTLPQYFGFGYGAGHHAPIVRTPLKRPDRVQRVMIVGPQHSQWAPAGYAPIGCHDGACMSHEHAYEHWEHATPAIMPTTAPQPADGAIPPQSVPASPPAEPLPPYRTSWRMVVP